MKLAIVDAVFSEDKQKIDHGNFAQAAVVIKQSSEFRRIVQNALAVGKKDQLFAANPELDAIIQTLMIMMIWTGYRIHEQEVGAMELEAFFNEKAILPELPKRNAAEPAEKASK